MNGIQVLFTEVEMLLQQALRAHSGGCWLGLTGRYFVETRHSTAVRYAVL